MPPNPLTNFEIQKYCENEPKFNGVYSRNNLFKMKDGTCIIIDLDEYKLTGSHWIDLYNANNVTYSFGVEHIPKQIRKFIDNKNITNIYRIQAYDSIMCGYFCIGFIVFMLKGKSLLVYTNLFSPNDYEKNDNTKIFSIIKKMKLYCVTGSKYRKFERPKISDLLEKALVLSIICSKCKNEDEKIFAEESIEISKILGLINKIKEYQEI